MSYMQVAAELRGEVKAFMDGFINDPDNPWKCDEVANQAAVKIGHIVNLAIRACPRGVQHTVRKNIVAEAVKDYCRVTMTEETDPVTGRSYHKIHIEPKDGG